MVDIPVIDVRGVNWLHAVGINSLADLAQRDAETLHDRCSAHAARSTDGHVLGKTPEIAEVRAWVSAAAAGVTGDIAVSDYEPAWPDWVAVEWL